MSKPTTPNPLTAEQRQQLEADYTFKRIVELGLNQVSRAVAFEQMPEREALMEYPELEAAYKTMHAAATYFASKMPGKIKAQEASLQSLRSDVQFRLNAGETANFSRDP